MASAGLLLRTDTLFGRRGSFTEKDFKRSITEIEECDNLRRGATLKRIDRIRGSRRKLFQEILPSTRRRASIGTYLAVQTLENNIMMEDYDFELILNEEWIGQWFELSYAQPVYGSWDLDKMIYLAPAWAVFQIIGVRGNNALIEIKYETDIEGYLGASVRGWVKPQVLGLALFAPLADEVKMKIRNFRLASQFKLNNHYRIICDPHALVRKEPSRNSAKVAEIQHGKIVNLLRTTPNKLRGLIQPLDDRSSFARGWISLVVTEWAVPTLAPILTWKAKMSINAQDFFAFARHGLDGEIIAMLDEVQKKQEKRLKKMKAFANTKSVKSKETLNRTSDSNLSPRQSGTGDLENSNNRSAITFQSTNSQKQEIVSSAVTKAVANSTFASKNNVTISSAEDFKKDNSPKAPKKKGGWATIMKFVGIKEKEKRKDVSVNETDEFDRTALLYACEFGHASLVEILVNRYHATPIVQDYEGRTSLHYACSVSEYDYLGSEVAKYIRARMVNYLLELHCDPNIRDLKGRTPLHDACEHWYEDQLQVIIRLTEAGAHWGLPDNNGVTPYDHMNQYLAKVTKMSPYIDPRHDPTIEGYPKMIQDALTLRRLLRGDEEEAATEIDSTAMDSDEVHSLPTMPMQDTFDVSVAAPERLMSKFSLSSPRNWQHGDSEVTQQLLAVLPKMGILDTHVDRGLSFKKNHTSRPIWGRQGDSEESSESDGEYQEINMHAIPMEGYHRGSSCLNEDRANIENKPTQSTTIPDSPRTCESHEGRKSRKQNRKSKGILLDGAGSEVILDFQALFGFSPDETSYLTSEVDCYLSRVIASGDLLYLHYLLSEYSYFGLSPSEKIKGQAVKLIVNNIPVLKALKELHSQVLVEHKADDLWLSIRLMELADEIRGNDALRRYMTLGMGSQSFDTLFSELKQLFHRGEYDLAVKHSDEETASAVGFPHDPKEIGFLLAAGKFWIETEDDDDIDPENEFLMERAEAYTSLAQESIRKVVSMFPPIDNRLAGKRSEWWNTPFGSKCISKTEKKHLEELNQVIPSMQVGDVPLTEFKDRNTLPDRVFNEVENFFAYTEILLTQITECLLSQAGIPKLRSLFFRATVALRKSIDLKATIPEKYITILQRTCERLLIAIEKKTNRSNSYVHMNTFPFDGTINIHPMKHAELPYGLEHLPHNVKLAENEEDRSNIRDRGVIIHPSHEIVAARNHKKYKFDGLIVGLNFDGLTGVSDNLSIGINTSTLFYGSNRSLNMSVSYFFNSIKSTLLKAQYLQSEIAGSIKVLTLINQDHCDLLNPEEDRDTGVALPVTDIASVDLIEKQVQEPLSKIKLFTFTIMHFTMVVKGQNDSTEREASFVVINAGLDATTFTRDNVTPHAHLRDIYRQIAQDPDKDKHPLGKMMDKLIDGQKWTTSNIVVCCDSRDSTRTLDLLDTFNVHHHGLDHSASRLH